ncbi:MAG TPA: DUF2079 domain-containing protein [Gaiellaceae bacterium]|jgi:uncharacterized membrane protein|nr:DUF2079 domain-containing protein [Gaiellaceae bacterium]
MIASRVEAGARARTLPTRLLLWTAVGAYAAGFSALSLLRHRSFETGRFDLGNMTQAVYTTAHGHFLEVTSLHGEQISRLAAHVDPILALFAPLWWVWPSPDMLLTVQAIAIGLGALPVYRLALRHLGAERPALGLALAYLLYPPVQWLALNEFHPVALATPLLLWGIALLDEERPLAFCGVALLAIATKEEVGLVVAAIGLWYALARRRRAWGIGICVAGAAASAVAIGLVIPHFNAGASSAFYGRYSEVGGSAGGILKTAFTDPLHVLSVAFDGRGIGYLLDLLLPLALLPLAAPLLALTALPELAINLLSSTPTQTSIHFHYTAPILAPFVAAAVLGAGRIARERRGVAGLLASGAVVACLAGNWLLGPIPLWRHVPGGETLQARAAEVSAHDRIAAEAVALVQDGAVVSASNSLGAHLSARLRILSFPYVQDATWVAVDERSPGYADRIAPLPYATRIAALRRNPAWRLVFERDGVLLFRRVSPP